MMEYQSTATLLVLLAIILIASKLGGHIASTIGQPAVLGKLVAGIVLGNLTLLGLDGLAHVSADPSLALLAELGVILLLFQVVLTPVFFVIVGARTDLRAFPNRVCS
jgi:Kef-type K+ transport system membrane component KefB